jgi:hypothetical protein
MNHMSQVTCFVDWLKPVVGDDKAAMCKFCRVTLKAHVNSLISHAYASTKKHEGFAKSMGSASTITNALKPNNPDPQHISGLKLAAYIAGIL